MVIKKGYKVVREIDGKFLPSVVSGTPFCYKIGKITNRVSGFGPFTLFDSIQNAKHFIGESFQSSLKIFKVEYKPAAESHLWATVDSIIEGSDEWVSSFPLGCCPPGTILADEVKLIKEIK